MGHCGVGGNGAKNFGRARRAPLTETEQADKPNSGDISQKTLNSVDTEKQEPTNLLLTLVEWVENDRAPDHIVGVTDDGKTTREHCRYPQRSIWNGNHWNCVP